MCGYVFVFEAEQDEDLDQLEETVISTKHIALAVNEELDLHTRLIVCIHLFVLFGTLDLESTTTLEVDTDLVSHSAGYLGPACGYDGLSLRGTNPKLVSFHQLE